MSSDSIVKHFDGQEVTISHPDKIYYPETKTTKLDCVNYVDKYWELISGFIVDRPMTFIHYPNGINNDSFFSKDKPDWIPHWISSINMEDGNDYVVIKQKADLIYEVNLASLEWHPGNSTTENIENPNQMIFDLDISEEHTFAQVKEVAHKLREHLSSYGYNSYIKTSGGSGLHVYCSIQPNYKIQEIYDAANLIAEEFVNVNSSTCTLELRKKKREGKILIDMYRNRKLQTCISPYSLRAKTNAPISFPIAWDDLEKITSSQFATLQNIESMIDFYGTPWRNFYQKATELHITSNSNLAD